MGRVTSFQTRSLHVNIGTSLLAEMLGFRAAFETRSELCLLVQCVC